MRETLDYIIMSFITFGTILDINFFVEAQAKIYLHKVVIQN